MTFQQLPIFETIEQIFNRFNQTFTKHKSLPIHAIWKKQWQESFAEIRKSATHPPAVTIAVVGGTGAGKSTLVNALLGERVLPISNSRACTSAISEAGFSPSGFAAKIEFISREEWRKEIELLLNDIGDEANANEQEPSSDAVSKAARDRLKAVYQISEEEIFRGLKLADLHESPEISEALDNGSISFKTDTPDDFRKNLRQYLDSKDKFWPLVKAAKIEGPFPGLDKQEAKIVDLPGLNDPNEAREKVTRDYLSNSKFVWIVFNSKRALTREIQDIMLSEDFARQIILDGRESALTFIGTHSDEFDRESSIDEFNLHEDALESEIVASRNKAVRINVLGQLEEMASKLARGAGEPSRSGELSVQLQKSRVFTVSAKDFLHLTGVSKNRSSTLDSIEETEIPALREHLKTISAVFTQGAHQEHLFHQLQKLVLEIQHRIKTEIQNLTHSHDLTIKKRKEIRDALNRLLTFLSQNISFICQEFDRELNSKHDLLSERTRHAFELGKVELQGVTQKWAQIHWSTLRAIVRRNGYYISPTSGEYDFAKDISRPTLKAITLEWVDFFGEKTKQALAFWSEKLNFLADKHATDTLQEVRKFGGPELDSFVLDLKASLEITKNFIKDDVAKYQNQMADELQKVRSTLQDKILDHVSLIMREAYEKAEDESGAGMKLRILTILSDHATRLSKSIFDNSRDKIMEDVRIVTDIISRNYSQTANNVAEKLAIPVSKFFQDDSQTAHSVDLVLNELKSIEKEINLDDLLKPCLA